MQDSLRIAIEERFEQVEDKKDYDALLNTYRTSGADSKTREEAIEMLKKKFPHFDDSEHITPEEVKQAIKDGEADIDDLTGF